MIVKPVTGRTVRDPVKGTFLPESGSEVPDNSFWRRRLNDGDVVREQPKEAKPAPEATKAEKNK
ncbi:TPA: DUF2635 domain-containing protein [Yersinia enterocolitica]|uniref:DUF2635 domain-containing protein n=1 Tax=Yersinia enterocolitica TaxID=630 RepID=UPI00285EA3E0|nr:DUF2635 domain-containing protein [Yersinia enterocolitica]HDL7917930.1 DUF2635 domain-containing protein [Yersinia enterocolitica]HDV5951951.1 DUF2635 domain-containing protein [Yersinia enterocolitica]HED5569088.1 DUF2635 domain-containing protein [Yersinia enterocolitica]HEN3351290.1 DUF2635 domain-containing protein [Yersinia enterocolitica]